MLDVGDRLPNLDLAAPGDARPSLPLRSPPKGAPVLLLPPLSGNGDGASSYARDFAASVAAFRLWYGRPLLVVPSAERATALIGDGDGNGGAGAGESGADGLQVAVDPDGELRRRLGLDDASWGVFVADRWGILYHVARSPETDALLGVGEIEEWLRYLATQCPECGVIDEPIPSRGWNPP